MAAEGHLSEEEYLSFRTNKLVLDSLEKRRHTYKLFLAYQRFKKAQGYFDHLDVVHHVYRFWLLEGHAHTPIHFLYVDEVQVCPPPPPPVRRRSQPKPEHGGSIRADDAAVWGHGWGLYPPPTAPRRALMRPSTTASYSPGDVLEEGQGGGSEGEGALAGTPPPLPPGSPLVPAEGGPNILKRKSSCHRRR